MKKLKMLVSLSAIFVPLTLWAQDTPSDIWPLNKCITYAMEKNLDIRKAQVSAEVDKQYIAQKEGLRYPTLSANLTQYYQYQKTLNADYSYSDYNAVNYNTSSINSSLTLFNGFKINNNVRLAKLSYQAGLYDVETSKENISLSILNAYLQVIYAKEIVKIDEDELASTNEQLKLAEERIKVGLLSKADYLQIKAQQSTDKLSLINNQNNYQLTRLSLMQLLELPSNTSFDIEYPDLNNLSKDVKLIDAEVVYNIALSIKPQIKSAKLNKDIAELNIKTAKADLMPKLTLNGSLSEYYNHPYYNISASSQLQNRVQPSLSFNLSIPIFQQNQVKTAVKIAKLNTQTAELNESQTKLNLRKAVEQACLDYNSAQKKLEAAQESYLASKESYEVAVEKFAVGLISSSDFIVQKTKYLSASSELLQAKFNAIFSNKILDFYTGTSITL